MMGDEDCVVALDPGGLSHAELARVVRLVQLVLWGTEEGMDPGKEWGSGTIEQVADVLAQAGLRPAEPC